jgi:hypothetical protein
MTPQPQASHDPVAHPRHYTFGGIEVIDAIEAWSLGFHLGNVVKYVARAAHKGSYLEDLRKARWYLDREIERRADELNPDGDTPREIET